MNDGVLLLVISRVHFGRLPHILSCCHIVPWDCTLERAILVSPILCAIAYDPTPSCLHGFNISSQ
jgi:hypothetical protein